MKERPIIFSGPMVRAILDGRKTQTRRVIKPQPKLESLHFPYMSKPKDAYVWRPRKDTAWFAWKNRDFRFDPMMYSDGPFNGDLLWVRETWGIQGSTCIGKGYQREFFSAPQLQKYTNDYWKTVIKYKASDDLCQKWWRSIHMPKWATRLWLRITNVRVERVQEIRLPITEGIEYRYNSVLKKPEYKVYGKLEKFDQWTKDPRWSFETLWDSLNAKRGYSWESNPFVWVVEFERMKP